MHEQIKFSTNGESRWAGMGNYLLVSPDGQHQIILRYAGEPPHGDSFHDVEVDGVRLPGLAWGCNFAFTADSRFIAASWMATRYERHTIVVDISGRRYFVLPIYIHDFSFRWPTLAGIGSDDGLRFKFDGTEVWTPF